FTTLVNQGEELCALARVDGPGPETVVIRGTLNGRPYERELPVRDVTPNAGYLPRTWAKLEIERLLAEWSREPLTKLYDRIVELSKAMYVMTPFTSLLVLENEEMYQQYKVDRGRKDHWAMYPCPDKIPVVAEDADGQPIDPRKGAKPTARQVRETILTRESPHFLRWTESGVKHERKALGGFPRDGTDRQNRSTIFAPIRPGLAPTSGQIEPGRLGENSIAGDLIGDPALPFVTERLEEKYGALRSNHGRVESPVLMLEQIKRQQLAVRARSNRSSNDARINFLREGNKSEDLARANYFGLRGTTTRATAASFQQDRLELLVHQAREPENRFERVLGFTQLHGGAHYLINGIGMRLDGRGGTPDIQEQIQELGDDWFDRREIPSLLYQRPSYSGEDRFFYDLVSYAPGMSVSRADVLATVEAEAAA